MTRQICRCSISFSRRRNTFTPVARADHPTPFRLIRAFKKTVKKIVKAFTRNGKAVREYLERGNQIVFAMAGGESRADGERLDRLMAAMEKRHPEKVVQLMQHHLQSLLNLLDLLDAAGEPPHTLVAEPKFRFFAPCKLFGEDLEARLGVDRLTKALSNVRRVVNVLRRPDPAVGGRVFTEQTRWLKYLEGREGELLCHFSF